MSFLSRLFPFLRPSVREVHAAVLRLAIGDVHSLAGVVDPPRLTTFLSKAGAMIVDLVPSRKGKVVAYDVADWTIALPCDWNKNLTSCAHEIATKCLMQFRGLVDNCLPKTSTAEIHIGIAMGRVILSSGTGPTAILGETVNLASKALRAAIHLEASVVAIEKYEMDKAVPRDIPGVAGEILTFFEWPTDIR